MHVWRCRGPRVLHGAVWPSPEDRCGGQGWSAPSLTPLSSLGGAARPLCLGGEAVRVSPPGPALLKERWPQRTLHPRPDPQPVGAGWSEVGSSWCDPDELRPCWSGGRQVERGWGPGSGCRQHRASPAHSSGWTSGRRRGVNRFCCSQSPSMIPSWGRPRKLQR